MKQHTAKHTKTVNPVFDEVLYFSRKHANRATLEQAVVKVGDPPPPCVCMRIVLYCIVSYRDLHAPVLLTV